MAERVIWERTIDHEAIEERKQRFIKRFTAPAAVIVLVVLIFGGVRNAIGAAVVIGLIGLGWGNTVRYKSLSDQANPTMIVRNDRLIVGNREVIIEDIKRFTTMATQVQTSVLGNYSKLDIGKAVFRMDVPGTKSEPDLVEIGWPNMNEEGVSGVQTALQDLMPGKWVDPVELVDPNEISTRRRPRLL